MILNKVTDQNWTDSFSKMVSSLLTKLPIVVDIEFAPDSCHIVNRTHPESPSYRFIYNFNSDPRSEVFNFRSWIVFNWCPKLVKEKVESRAPSSSEVSERLEEQRLGSTVDPYKSIVETVEEVFWIEKINPKKREVVLTTHNLQGNKIILKMHVPIYKFIKEYHSNLTVQQATKYFFENSEELYIYYAKEHYGKI